MIENLCNLLKVKNINNDLNENFGCKKLKDVIIWYEDEKNNFAIFEVEIMEIVIVTNS